MRNGPPSRRRAESRALYGTLPRDVLHHPPVHAWRPFDIAVACALSVKARFELAEQRHIRALDIGAATIKDEKQYAADFRADWRKVKERRRRGEEAPAPERLHAYDLSHTEYKPAQTVRDSLTKAGKVGYRQARERLRKESPPEFVEIELSRFALLRFAHLSTDAKNRRELDATLRRLQNAVRVNGVRRPPLIVSINKSVGRLRLQIAGVWLEPPFGPVPLPLPTRSSTATALYLFLQSVRTTRANSRAVNFEDLCSRIGIDTTQPLFRCKQALHRALGLVNRYVGRLDEDVLDRHGIPAVNRYSIKAAKGGDRVRFVAALRLTERKERENSGDYAGRERVMPRRNRLLKFDSNADRTTKLAFHEQQRKLWKAYDDGDRWAGVQLGQRLDQE